MNKPSKMRKMSIWKLCAAMFLAMAIGASAHADVMGFNNGAGWTANTGCCTSGIPVFSGNSVEMTNSTQSDATSVWFNTPQALGSFTASFTYTAVWTAGNFGLNPADGVTFAIQNVGTNQVGFGGGDFGYAGIAPSAAIELNIFGSSGTQFDTNGQTYQSGGPPNISTSPLNLSSQDGISVNLVYDSSADTIVETLTDAAAGTSFSHTYSGIDLAGIIGNSQAYIGFTAGTGGGDSTQTISNVEFATATPEPGSLLLLGTGLAGLAGTLRRKLGK